MLDCLWCQLHCLYRIALLVVLQIPPPRYPLNRRWALSVLPYDTIILIILLVEFRIFGEIVVNVCGGLVRSTTFVEQVPLRLLLTDCKRAFDIVDG